MSDDLETRLKMLGVAAIGTIMAIGFGGGFGDKKRHEPSQSEDRYRAPSPPRNYDPEYSAAMDRHHYRVPQECECESETVRNLYGLDDAMPRSGHGKKRGRGR